jgi:hypothetical protein
VKIPAIFSLIKMRKDILEAKVEGIGLNLAIGQHPIRKP